MPTRKRRIIIAGVVAYSLIWLAATYLGSTGHGLLGIGILAGVGILPEFVIVPLTIKRANRVAAEARAKRESRTSPDA